MMKYIQKTFLYSVAYLWLAISVYPIIFAIQTGFKSQTDFMMNSALSLPQEWLFNNIKTVAFEGGFYRNFLNSIYVTTVSLVALIFFSSIIAYVLSKERFKGRKLVYLLFLFGLYIPLHITLIPTYRLSNMFNIYNSLTALMGPFIAFSMPVAVILLTRFMNDIPNDFIEAASLEGASKINIYKNVALPMSKSAIMTISIWSGVLFWNEFIYPLILTNKKSNAVIPLALWRFRGEYAMNVPLILMSVLISLIPILIIYSIFSDKIINGMSMHSMK